MHFVVHPGDPIRPVDPIVFNRIRVGFHRKPTSFIKNRSDPIQIIQIRPHPIPHESPGQFYGYCRLNDLQTKKKNFRALIFYY
jgi:hypothetical protein